MNYCDKVNIKFVPQASYKQKTLQRPKKARDITEEQKQEIKEAFDLFDTDGSGNID